MLLVKQLSYINHHCESLPSTPGGAGAPSPATRERGVPLSGRRRPISPVHPSTSLQTPPLTAQPKTTCDVVGGKARERDGRVHQFKNVVTKIGVRKNRVETLLDVVACISPTRYTSVGGAGQSHGRLLSGTDSAHSRLRTSPNS